jgi:cysteine synthase
MTTTNAIKNSIVVERHNGVYRNILQAVGHTPLVRLNQVVFGNSTASIFAKVEFFNPAGSIKDRIGLSIIENAEAEAIKPSGTFVEATLAIPEPALALAAAVKGIAEFSLMQTNER